LAHSIKFGNLPLTEYSFQGKMLYLSYYSLSKTTHPISFTGLANIEATVDHIVHVVLMSSGIKMIRADTILLVTVVKNL